MSKTYLAELFDTTRQTIHRWCKRAYHKSRESFKGEPRNPRRGKTTGDVEASILALRRALEWGTARIQQRLHHLPEYVREAVQCIQNVRLSRTAINNILKKHGINGYKHDRKIWRFFRAEEPNELWQLDIKGPHTIRGQRHWFVACTDDRITVDTSSSTSSWTMNPR